MSSDARARLAALLAARPAARDLIPLSSGQQRMWLVDQSLPGLPAYHIVRVLHLRGALDIAALTTALAIQLARHQSLRTGVLAVDGTPFAQVNPVTEARLPVREVAAAAIDAEIDALARAPFEFSGEPLLRAVVLRSGPLEHRLVLVLHHVVADAASVEIVVRDLLADYALVHAGAGPDRTEREPFRGYVEQERRHAAGAAGERDLAAWVADLDGIQPLQLPTAARAPLPRRPGALASASIPAPVAAALRSLGRSLVPSLLAAYALVLHRVSDQDDLVVGMPVSGRHSERWQHTVGLFVATVPIRVRIGENPSFRDLAARVDAAVLGAIDRQRVPMEQVVARLDLARSPGRNPLFDVTFGLLTPPAALPQTPGLTVGLERRYGGHAKFDLHLEALDAGPGSPIDLDLEYDADLFEPDFAVGLLAAVTTAAAAATLDPDRAIGSVPLIGRRPAADPPPPLTVRLDTRIRELARATPTAVALLEPGRAPVSFGELVERADALAARLVGAGVRAGDHVATTVPRSIEAVVADLAILIAGAAYVPLDLDYPPARTAAMIADAGVRVAVTPAGRDGLPVTEIAVAAPADGSRRAPAPPVPDGRCEAYVMFTSGSTGRPKPVLVTHAGVARLATDARLARGRWLHASTRLFDAATLEVWVPLLRGDSVVVLPGRVGTAEIGAAIRELGVEVAFLTAGLFNVVVDEDPAVLAPLLQIVTGGDVMSAAHARRALEVVPSVVNAYGPTETSVVAAMHPLTRGAPVPDPVPVGAPAAGIRAVVADSYGGLLPDGLQGELLLGGPPLALGYAGRGGLTAERFVPDPEIPGERLYRTGDRARLGADGAIRFAGRRDAQVKVRGFRVELTEIEAAAMTVPGVEQAAVVAAGPEGERYLAGFWVGPATAAAIGAALAATLPAHLRPSRWTRLSELPLGTAGKIDRATLAAGEDRGRADVPAAAAVAGTVPEQLLHAWFVDLLGRGDIPADADFFALGGHSLLAARLAARIRSGFGVDLPLATVFNHPRLPDLARAVAQAPRRDLPPLLPADPEVERPLSAAQRRLWFLHRLDPQDPAYNIPLALDLTGQLSEAEVRAGLDRMVRRHPILRSVVVERDGEPHQRVLPAGCGPDLGVVDLRGLPEAMRAEALDQIARATWREAFDLGTPALRAVLVLLSPGHGQLLLCVHHLLADGWSVPRMLAALTGADTGPPDAVGYGDFAAWQNACLAGPLGDRLEDYWRAQLSGAPTRLVVPGDAAASAPQEAAVAGFPGSVHRFTVDAGATRAARALARACGTTLFSTLLTIFGGVLAGRTGRDDLLVGTPVAGRTEAATMDLVGLFANTVPLRCRVPTQTDLASAARAVGATVAAALTHAELPFEHIVDLVDLERTPGEVPLVQVVFALQPALVTTYPWAGAVARLQTGHPGTAKFDLTLSLVDDGTDLAGYLEFRTDRYTPAFAAALVADLETSLLRARPEQPLPLGRSAAPAPAPPPPDPPRAGVAAPLRAGADADRVAEIWRAVLGRDEIGADDDFFALGGHSLAAVRMIARLRDSLGVEVPVRAIFDHPRLGDFAARVHDAPPAAAGTAIEARSVTGPVRLSPGQERLWVLQHLEPDTTGHSVPFVLQVTGRLDIGRLEQALTLLAVRQAILRTGFTVLDGIPHQVVHDPHPIVTERRQASATTLDQVLGEVADQPLPLGTAPPWRATVVTVSDDDHRLVLNLHHILTDGWSTGVLVRELAAIYDAHDLPPLTLQYTDYARWARERDEDAALTRRVAALRGAAELELPTDRPRGAAGGHRGGHLPVRLAAGLVGGLERVAAQTRTSLFAVLLGVHAEALARLSGQRDIAVGSFHANRPTPATEAVVGYFVNTIAVRCDTSGRPTWAELVTRVGAAAQDAMHDAGTPFERIVEALQVPRSLDRTPVFATMCVLQNLPDLPARLGEGSIRYVRRPYERADFELTLWLSPAPDGALDGGISFDAGLFDDETVAAYRTLLLDLAAHCATDPVCPPALPGDAPRRPQLPAPTGPLVHEQVLAQAARTPDAPALHWLDGAGAPTRMSYAALAAAAHARAARLRAAGVGPEVPVAVVLERSPEAVVTMLAVLLAGGCYVPIDPDYPAARVAHLIALSRATIVVSDRSHAHLLGDPATVLWTEDPEPVGCEVAPRPVPGEALAYVIFTSGSTGQPKGVMVSHDNLRSYLAAILPELRLTPTDRVLNFASTSFDATTEELYPALVAGASCVLRPADLRLPDERFDAFLAATTPSVLSLPVTFWDAWVRRLAAEDAGVPGHVHTLLLNAEEPSVERYRRWRERTDPAGIRFVNTYGPTEGTVTASLYVLDDPAAPGPDPDWHERWGRFPVGRPLGNTAAGIRDALDRPAPPGARGELVLGGPAVTRGYLGAPGRTADAYRPDPDGPPGSRLYRTGDLARVLRDGTVLLLGRADRQVKIRGHRVELGELEAVLATLPGAGPVAALTRESHTGRELVAWVAAAPASLGDDAVRHHVAARLPDYFVPARVLVREELPLTPNGKVDRLALAAGLESELAAAPAGPRPDLSPVEETLLTICADVLGRPDLQVTDNFFAAGGDSIRALLVVTRARSQGLALGAPDIFRHQSVADLARATATAPDPGHAPPVAASGEVPGARLSRRQADRVRRRIAGGGG